METSLNCAVQGKILIRISNKSIVFEALEREDRYKFSDEQNECQQREEAERGLTADKKNEEDRERRGTKFVLVSNVSFKVELTITCISSYEA